MSERFFRYVRCKQAYLWEQAGWNVISVPLTMQPPIDVVIVEWQRPGQPVEPEQGVG